MLEGLLWVTSQEIDQPERVLENKLYPVVPLDKPCLHGIAQSEQWTFARSSK